MQDLTTGSVTRHLLKTTSYMLVTMIFQTLYFLVDLYWVGRLGKEAVAGVAIAGNLTFIVLAVTQMLGVGVTTLVSHAAGQKDRDRAVLIFNESLLLSALVGVLFFAIGMALRMPYVTGARCRLTDRRAGGRLSALVHPRDVAAVRDGEHGRGAARNRQLQAGHDRPDHDHRDQHRARAVSHFRVGHGTAAWRRRRGDLVARRDRRRVDLAVDVLSGHELRT